MNCSINRKNLPIYETQSGFLVTFAATPSPDFPTYGSKGVQCKLSRNIKKDVVLRKIVHSPKATCGTSFSQHN